MGDSEFRRDVPHKYKSKSPSLTNYFDHIEKELTWLKEKGNVKPSPEFFEGEERKKLLAAQAKGEPVTVRIMLTHHQAIRETLDSLIAKVDRQITEERKRSNER